VIDWTSLVGQQTPSQPSLETHLNWYDQAAPARAGAFASPLLAQESCQLSVPLLLPHVFAKPENLFHMMPSVHQMKLSPLPGRQRP
jgi:hypothetical protein